MVLQCLVIAGRLGVRGVVTEVNNGMIGRVGDKDVQVTEGIDAGSAVRT